MAEGPNKSIADRRKQIELHREENRGGAEILRRDVRVIASRLPVKYSFFLPKRTVTPIPSRESITDAIHNPKRLLFPVRGEVVSTSPLSKRTVTVCPPMENFSGVAGRSVIIALPFLKRRDEPALNGRTAPEKIFVIFTKRV